MDERKYRRTGVDGVLVPASAKELVPLGMDLLAMGGHLLIFAGMSKQDPCESIDLNAIHYRELHLHGANSSVRRDYEEAIRLIETGRLTPIHLLPFALRWISLMRPSRPRRTRT